MRDTPIVNDKKGGCSWFSLFVPSKKKIASNKEKMTQDETPLFTMEQEDKNSTHP